MLSLGGSPCEGGPSGLAAAVMLMDLAGNRAGLLPITAFGVFVVLTALPLRRGTRRRVRAVASHPAPLTD